MCLHLKIKSFGCAAPDKTTLHWDSTFYFNAFYNWFCLSVPSVRQPHRSKDWKTSTELLSFAQISTGEIPTPGPCRSVPLCCWDKVSSQVSVTNHCFSWWELSYSSTIHHEHLHLWSDSTGKKKKEVIVLLFKAQSQFPEPASHISVQKLLQDSQVKLRQCF